jgi:hypothetical protein
MPAAALQSGRPRQLRHLPNETRGARRACGSLRGPIEPLRLLVRVRLLDESRTPPSSSGRDRSVTSSQARSWQRSINSAPAAAVGSPRGRDTVDQPAAGPPASAEGSVRWEGAGRSSFERTRSGPLPSAPASPHRRTERPPTAAATRPTSPGRTAHRRPRGASSALPWR